MSRDPGMDYPRFHLALPVGDLAAAAEFYGGVLGCTRGRESTRWIDFDFWGHQLVVHLVEETMLPGVASNPVDEEMVPASHFGPILAWEEFDHLLGRLRASDIKFIIEPTTRFAGRRGEQRTLFVKDPSSNHLEFKCFRNPEMLFATDGLDYP
jgi:extradiol dioxygenase family protein